MCDHHWHWRNSDKPDVVTEIFCENCDHTIEIKHATDEQIAKAREKYHARHGSLSISEGISLHK